jgi:hypothetical protein
MKDKDHFQIYVYLLNEGVDVWRPVDAVQVNENVYRIVARNPDPEDEQWEFNFGDLVRCKERQSILENKIFPAAYELVAGETSN